MRKQEMTSVDQVVDLLPFVNQTIGTSSWLDLSRERVLEFAKLTDDTHWIHIDGERVRRDTQYSDALVHGFLLTALLTSMFGQILEVRTAQQWLNYGMDRLRFITAVPVGSRVRLVQTLLGVELQSDRRAKLRLGCVMEVEGSERPALAAEWMMVVLW